jgi:hypothetical protein
MPGGFYSDARDVPKDKYQNLSSGKFGIRITNII